MQKLLRLAGWGVAATAALLFAVIAANSSSGRQRLSGAFADVTGARASEAAKTEAAQAAQLARIAANEADTRRLIEMVRSLAGDRERLMARMAALEQNLEDVTGSFKRQAALTPPAGTPTPSAPAAGPQPTVAATPPNAPTAEPPNRAATVGPPGNLPELQPVEARPAAGVDLGGARDFDGLRTLWSITTATNPELFDGLHAIVTVREDSRSRAADLRLVAGPLTDVETASRICSTLAAAKRFCRLVAFEGQPLALNAPPPPPPPRRPAATAPKPRPTAKAAP
jgi:hypothetical protein